MIWYLLLIVGVTLATPGREVLQSPGLLNAEFTRFQLQQGREYKPAELRFRLRVFRDNLKQIVECNEKESTYRCAENMFTDMTDSEKSSFTGLQNVTDNNFSSHGPLSSTLGAPAAKDWRNHNAVTAVKNQGQCGSCWTFSAIGAIEGAYAVATNVLKAFSEQELLDCTYETMYPGYDGCNGGWYYDSFNYIKTTGRLAREVNYSYRAADGACSMDGVPNDLGTARLTSYVEVGKGDEALAGALAISPVSVAMLSYGTFYNYRDGIYDGSDCQCNWSPNHALTAVAYAADHFVIKNSWGKTWGDQGYIKIARGMKHTVCRAGDFVYYPIFSADGTEPTLPPTIEPTTSQVGPTDDNDGCPQGTTRCPDGTCKHIHMC